MPRNCTICSHQDRQSIDQAIVEGETLRRIGAKWGVSVDALKRHKKHLSQALVESARAEVVANADDLLAQIESLQQKTLYILAEAESKSNYQLALKAIAEARRNLELLAELTHELDRSPKMNILLSPDWVRLRGLILEALSPYPEARLRVAQAVMEVTHADPGA
jgi:hypothetical protein